MIYVLIKDGEILLAFRDIQEAYKAADKYGFARPMVVGVELKEN